MKRSEMIKILRDSFIYHMNPPDTCCKSDVEMYSCILKDLEKAGMLPPDTGQGYFVSVNYGTQYANYEERQHCYKWEDEE